MPTSFQLLRQGEADHTVNVQALFFFVETSLSSYHIIGHQVKQQVLRSHDHVPQNLVMLSTEGNIFKNCHGKAYANIVPWGVGVHYITFLCFYFSS